MASNFLDVFTHTTGITMSEIWIPIKDAFPSELVLLTDDDGINVYSGFWDDDCWNIGLEFDPSNWWPTHWMPLPDPPK